MSARHLRVLLGSLAAVACAAPAADAAPPATQAVVPLGHHHRAAGARVDLNGVDPNGVDPNGVDPNGVDPNGDHAPALSAIAARGTAPLRAASGFSTRTADILSSVVSGDGFDVPLKSLAHASGDRAPARVTSVRGPNVPETQSLVQPPPQQQAGTAGKAGRAATAPPRSKAAALADEKAEMDKAWQSFVSIKGNTLPPMEGSSAGGSTAATATTASALAGAAAQQSAPQPLKEGSHDLANKAMEEYDASARHHALKDPHRQYLQAVQTLRDNAATLNRNARPTARLGGGGAGSGNLDDGGGMSNSGGRVAGVLGGGGAV